jgi:hypothetical protein
MKVFGWTAIMSIPPTLLALIVLASNYIHEGYGLNPWLAAGIGAFLLTLGTALACLLDKHYGD